MTENQSPWLSTKSKRPPKKVLSTKGPLSRKLPPLQMLADRRNSLLCLAQNSPPPAQMTRQSSLREFLSVSGKPCKVSTGVAAQTTDTTYKAVAEKRAVSIVSSSQCPLTSRTRPTHGTDRFSQAASPPESKRFCRSSSPECVAQSDRLNVALSPTSDDCHMRSLAHLSSRTKIQLHETREACQCPSPLREIQVAATAHLSSHMFKEAEAHLESQEGELVDTPKGSCSYKQSLSCAHASGTYNKQSLPCAHASGTYKQSLSCAHASGTYNKQSLPCAHASGTYNKQSLVTASWTACDSRQKDDTVESASLRFDESQCVEPAPSQPHDINSSMVPGPKEILQSSSNLAGYHANSLETLESASHWTIGTKEETETPQDCHHHPGVSDLHCGEDSQTTPTYDDSACSSGDRICPPLEIYNCSDKPSLSRKENFTRHTGAPTLSASDTDACFDSQSFSLSESSPSIAPARSPSKIFSDWQTLSFSGDSQSLELTEVAAINATELDMSRSTVCQAQLSGLKAKLLFEMETPSFTQIH